MNRYRVLTQPVSGWTGEPHPGIVVVAHKLVVCEGGGLIFCDYSNNPIRALAAGHWREVALDEGQSDPAKS